MSRNAIKFLLKSPHLTYLILAVLFTGFFLFSIPPMTTPDAPNHFTRAYAISTGKLFASETGPGAESQTDTIAGKEVGIKTTNKGYWLPRNIVEYTKGPDYCNNKIASDTNHPGMCFYYQNQTEGNSPIAYFPQVLAIRIARIFTNSPSLLAYAQEFILASIWIVCIFFSIRATPFGKWAIVFISLLPMQIQVSFQLGADVMTIAPATLLTAIFMRRVFSSQASQSSKKELFFLSFLLLLSTQSKIVMIPLIFLLLCYPLDYTPLNYRKGSFTHALPVRGFAAIIPIIFLFSWSLIAKKTERSLADVFSTAQDQIQYLSSEPLHFILSWLLNCYHWLIFQIDISTIIGNLKSMHAPLPIGFIIFGFVFLCIVLASTTNTEMEQWNSISKKRYSALFLTSLLCFVAISISAATLLAENIIWTPINSDGIFGVQGRYFFPVLYLLAMLPPVKPILIKDDKLRNAILAASLILFLASSRYAI